MANTYGKDYAINSNSNYYIILKLICHGASCFKQMVPKTKRNDRLKEKERERRKDLTRVSTTIYRKKGGSCLNCKANNNVKFWLRAKDIIRAEARYTISKLRSSEWVSKGGPNFTKKASELIVSVIFTLHNN